MITRDDAECALEFIEDSAFKLTPEEQATRDKLQAIVDTGGPILKISVELDEVRSFAGGSFAEGKAAGLALALKLLGCDDG